MTTSAVMMLVCLSYLMFRQGIANPDQRRTVAAYLGILLMGAMLVTIIVPRIRLDTIHPVVIGASPQNTQGGVSMSPSMTLTLLVNLFVWGLLVTPALIWWRIRLENAFLRVQADKP